MTGGGQGLARYMNPLTGIFRFTDYLVDTDLNTTDRTYTVTGSTAPTTVTHAHGGTAAFTNTTSDNDRIEVDETSEWIKLGLGRQCTFVYRFKVNEKTQVDLGMGIGIIDTDWLGDTAVMSDGIFIEKNDGDAYLDLVIAYNATAVADYQRAAAIYTIADDTWYDLQVDIYMDSVTAGKGRIVVRIDGNVVSDATYTGLPYDEELCRKFGVQQGEATNAKTLTLDYDGAGIDRFPAA